MAQEVRRYDNVAMGLHWLTAALMIVMIFAGEALMEGAETSGGAAPAAPSPFLPSLHVSIGILILALSLVRLAWRLANPPPPSPHTMKAWEARLASTTHVVFYLLMVLLPVTGWLAFPYLLQEQPTMAGVSVFGLSGVPAAPLTTEAVKGTHNLLSKLAMVLLILHVLAALKHQFVDRDGALTRMLPG